MILFFFLTDPHGCLRPCVKAADPATVEGTVTGTENQPMSVSVAPIEKKKYAKKSVQPVRDQSETGSSQEQEKEAELEIITQSLSLSELCDMQKDFSRHTGEHIVTWLLRSWDKGGSSIELEDREARQLGVLAREGGNEQTNGKKAQALSLWRQHLSCVRERHTLSKDVVCYLGKWTNMESGIQYLRELVVWELVN